jgi:hypothetical protein
MFPLVSSVLSPSDFLAVGTSPFQGVIFKLTLERKIAGKDSRGCVLEILPQNHVLLISKVNNILYNMDLNRSDVTLRMGYGQLADSSV